MSNSDIPFFSQTAVLDRYAHTSAKAVDPTALRVVVKALRVNKDLRTYFFRSGPDYSWAEVLWDNGFFITPPDPEPTKEGYILPRWVDQEYLISVAKYVPSVVLEHVKAIKGHSAYIERAIHALLNISAEQVGTVLSIILDWLDDPQIGSSISLKGFELMTALAKAGSSESAFSLFQKLTTPWPSKTSKSHGDYVFGAEAIAIFPFNFYERETLSKGLAALQEIDIGRTVRILEEQLDMALRLEAELKNDLEYKSRSFWRTAIEDTGQDAHEDYKDILLQSLRDILESWARQDPGAVAPLIERYLTDPHEILRRLALHLLQTFPTNYTAIVARELLKPENLEDVGIHHEFFLLLSQGYPHLSSSEQETLVHSIIAGPSQEQVERIADSAADDEEEQEKYAKSYSRWWILTRLWMLKAHLGGEPKELLEQLEEEMGQPEHPEFTSWVSGGFGVSDVSPITLDELKAKRPEELLEYVKSWQPSKDRIVGYERESYGALGGLVAEVLMSDVEKFGDMLTEIAALRPEYATSLLVYSPHAEIDPTKLWDFRLNLTDRLLSNNRICNDMEISYEGGWVNFRSSVVHLLKDAIVKEESTLPEDFFPRVRDIFLILIDDPDPTLESDRPGEGWLGHNDPLTVAINHVRPEALAALITYSRQMALRRKEEAERGFGVERLEPIVKEALSRKVSRYNDPSLALHSVFGRELIALFWLSRQWTEEHIDEIFPPGEDEESIAFYVAAWDSYMAGNRTVYLEIFRYLRPKYERAIENVSKGYVTKSNLQPVKALAKHLLLEYLESSYDIRSPEGAESLVVQFFNKTKPDARGQAAWGLKEICQPSNKKFETYWPRAKSLWQWRVDEASSTNYSTEFNDEMIGFSYLLLSVPESETLISIWPLIERMLPYIGRDERWDRVWHAFQEYVATEVERDPVRAIQLYRLMHDQLNAPIQYYDDKARKIIETTAANRESRKEALMLIEKIARTGNYEFNSIHETYS